MKRIGIDGCSGGFWLVASGTPEAGSLTFSLVSDLSSLFAEARAGRAGVTVDIPIGLPENGPRDCDLAARRFLAGRGSCVFPTPCRSVLRAQSYAEACELSAAACGKRLSQQAYAITPLIAHVDRLIDPEMQAQVREVHPEVTFAVLAGQPVAEPKSTREGQGVRLALLARFGLEPDVEKVRTAFGRSRVAPDDVLDACAALLTAYRIADSTARVFPDDRVQRDVRGLRMEIVA